MKVNKSRSRPGIFTAAGECRRSRSGHRASSKGSSMQTAFPAPVQRQPILAVLPLGRRRSADASPPERAPGRRDESPLLKVLLAALDELDYGVVVLDEDRRAVHANHAGEVELARGGALCLEEGRVGTRSAAD